MWQQIGHPMSKNKENALQNAEFIGFRTIMSDRLCCAIPMLFVVPVSALPQIFILFFGVKAGI
jgi:hypothetical protein